MFRCLFCRRQHDRRGMLPEQSGTCFATCSPVEEDPRVLVLVQHPDKSVAVTFEPQKAQRNKRRIGVGISCDRRHSGTLCSSSLQRASLYRFKIVS